MAFTMQITQVAPTMALSSKKQTPAQLRATAPARRATVCSLGNVSRREAALAGVAALVAALPAPQAQALFGFDGKSAEEKYNQSTLDLIENILTTIALPRDAENRLDAIKACKDASNTWVAKYRRDPNFSGRPSYGFVYSAVNAVG